MADRSIVVRLRAEVSDFKRAMGEATKATEALPKSAERAETRMGRMVESAHANREAWDRAGATLTGFGVATLGGLSLATKAAMDWESAWTGVLKTVDGSEAELAAVEQGLRNLTRVLPASHTEIAAVAEAAGQLGISTEGVVAFTETMVNLGETTNLSAEEAATALARVRNIMGDTEADVSRMGATIVDLGNNSATTEREITDMGTRLAAAGKQAGLSTADVFAFASALTSVGVEAEAGGTAMSKVFTSIADAVRDGGPRLETFARVAGVSAAEFRRAFEQDAAGAISMFVEGMGRAAAAGESTTAIFQDLELTDQRLMRAILSTGSATGLLAEQLQTANGAWEANTALAIEAAKRYETTEAQMQLARNSINDAAITLGETFLPMLAEASQGVADFADWIGRLPTPVLQASGGIAAVGGTAALAAGSFLLLFPRVMDTVQAFKQLGPGTQTAFRNIGKGTAVLAAATVAFTALTAATRALAERNDTAVSSLETTTEALLNMQTASDLDSLFDGLGAGIDRVHGLEDAIDRLVAPSLMDRMQDFSGEIRGVFGWGETGRTETIKQLEQIGQSLAVLVQTGNAAEAARQFDILRTSWVEAGGEVEDLEGHLSAYTDALAAQRNEAALSTEGMDRVAAGWEYVAAANEEASEALQEWRDAVAASNQSFIDLQGGFDAVAAANAEVGEGIAVTSEQFIAELERQVAAQERWEQNIIGLSTRVREALPADMQAAADAMIDELMALGPEGAAQVQLLHDMTNEELARVVTLWGNKGGAAATEFTTQVENIRNPQIDVTANLTPAESAVREFMNRPRSITIGLDFSQGAGLTPRMQYASGGPVVGPGTSTSDSIPALLSNGEYVVKADAVARYGRATFDALNAMRYADGGYVGPAASGRSGPGGSGPATFHLYDSSGALLGTMRGVAEAVAQAGKPPAPVVMNNNLARAAVVGEV